MAVKARVNSEITVDEIIDDNAESLGSSYSTVRHTGFNLNTDQLDEDSEIAANDVAGFVKTLVAGSGSIDLTALNGTNGATVDGTGNKVKAIKFVADAANDEPVTISEGASDGYELLGDGWTIDLSPGQDLLLFAQNEAPTIGAAAKIIDLASTDPTAKLNVLVLLGEPAAE